MDLSSIDLTKLPLPPGKNDHIEWDDALPGFGVRLRPTKRVFVVQYRVGRQQRRESLGDVRKISLAAAHKIAKKRFAQVELGIDPAADRVQADAQAAAAKLTLAVVTTRYLDAKRDKLRSSTYKAAERYLNQHWKPLHNRPIDAIRRADVAARLQELTKAHGRTSAARARGNLSAMFGWAMREGLCKSNPVIATNDPSEGIQSRERVLGDDEIRIIWRACRDDDFGRIVRLLLLTGCRRDEIGGLRRSEINFDNGALTIPGPRTKSGRTLELMLPAIAIEILQSVLPRDGRDYSSARGAGLLQAGRRRSWASMPGSSSLRASRSRRGACMICGARCAPGSESSALRRMSPSWRSTTSKAASRPSTTGTGISAEIKAALALWDEHIRSVVEGGARKVVPLRSA